MSYKITWAQEAKDEYLEILRYLNRKWGEQSVISFQRKVESRLNVLSVFPEAFPSSQKHSQLRRSVIVKQVTLYYLVLEINKEVRLIRFADNRQNDE